MVRRLFGDFSYCLGYELDLPESIDVKASNCEVQLDIASLLVDCVDNLITYQTENRLNKLRATVAYVCNRLEVGCNELFINYLYTERR